MSKFFEAVKALFPQSRAFQLFIENKKYKLVKALCELPENVRKEGELVYFDLFPDTTRFPEKWENIFAIYFTSQELSKRRTIIDSLWKTIYGGQSAEYLQMVLQAIANIKVVENNPVINPRMVRVVELSVCGNVRMICGGKKAACGARLGKDKFIPSILRNDVSEFYDLPFDPNYWQTCFFVCKSVVRINNTIVYIEPLDLSAVWRNYLEYLILRIKPVHTTVIVFINWKEEDAV